MFVKKPIKIVIWQNKTGKSKSKKKYTKLTEKS